MLLFTCNDPLALRGGSRSGPRSHNQEVVLYMASKTVSVGRYTFTVTESIQEAKWRKRVVESEVDDISFQLSNRSRKGKTGHRMSSEDYSKWARGAKASRLQKVAEVRYLKDWITAARIDDEKASLGVLEGTDRALLIQVHRALEDLVGDPDINPLVPERTRSICSVAKKHLQEL